MEGSSWIWVADLNSEDGAELQVNYRLLESQAAEYKIH